jgi:hypothetical protein
MLAVGVEPVKQAVVLQTPGYTAFLVIAGRYTSDKPAVIYKSGLKNTQDI